MCLNPTTIYNRSTFLNIHGSHLYQEVPCGRCCECQDLKFKEYLVRSYYHFKHQSKGCIESFCFTDTLTYNDAALALRSPYGIPSFSRRDIQLFLKRLRRNLELKGYQMFNIVGYRKNGNPIKVSNLAYFITTEYGGKKYRPHYHISFYSRIPHLNVFDLKRAINASWVIKPLRKEAEKKYNCFGEPAECFRLGFTDSWYKTLSHTVKFSNDNRDFFRALFYVAKYIHKDQDYTKVVEDKKRAIIKEFDLDPKSRDEKVKEFEDTMKEFAPFHLQSQGFGLGFLSEDDFDYDDIVFNSKITLPDTYHVTQDYPVPLYYKRKLFYDLVDNGFNKDGKKKYRWELNNLGLEYKKVQFDKVFQKFHIRYVDIIANWKSYVPDLYKDYPIRETILELLDGRTIKDFTVYKFCYKGVILDPDIKEFYKKVGDLDLGDYKNFYFRQYYEKLYPNGFYSDEKDDPSIIHERNRFKQVAICQFSREDFRYFDELDWLINVLFDVKNRIKQKRADTIQSIESNLKKFLFN